MGKETKAAEQKVETPAQENPSAKKNVIDVKEAFDAVTNLDKKNKEKRTQDAEEAIACAIYYNGKTLAQLRARRREDDITKEKLNESKSLLERVTGAKWEIGKNGELTMTKEAIPADQRLTPSQYKEEKNKLDKKIAEKMNESSKAYDKEVQELRETAEFRYVDWWDR